MRTIIAPTNFSEESIHAVNYAADMALTIDADLLLLHVIEMPVSFDVPLTQYEYDSLLEDAEDELYELRKQLLIRTEAEINISTRAIFSTMENAMAEIGEEKKPFIIVIGPAKDTLAERYFFRSNTFTVLKNLHYPVIVVPQNAVFRHIKRIGLATDLKDIYDVPVNAIRSLANIFKAGVDIIHVCKNEDDKIENAARLTILKDRLKEFDPVAQFIISDNVEEALNKYAAQHHDDVLMVVGKKYNFFESLIHKSHSRQIARHTEIPVIAVAE